MPLTLERHQSCCVVRLEGQITLASATELKAVLLEWLAAGTNLDLDLERAAEIDLTAMQLLWAAGREAERRGVGIRCRMSEAAAAALGDSGFARLPGFPAAPVNQASEGSDG
ncbi:MAG: STAS domain-containing protein [Bryobacteraceae bacterium]|jgi:anti-anti-sigma regulatory factor